MSNNKRKGSNFEGEICKILSLWWSNGKRDDLFWKSYGSGNRATIRTKLNKFTEGQYGDICSTSSLSVLLTRFFTFEIKKGYPRLSFNDILDSNSKKNNYWFWFNKIENTINYSKTISWVLIHKKNNREILLFLPFSIYKKIVNKINNSFKKKIIIYYENKKIVGLLFKEFLEKVNPSIISSLFKEIKNDKKINN